MTTGFLGSIVLDLPIVSAFEKPQQYS